MLKLNQCIIVLMVCLVSYAQVWAQMETGQVYVVQSGDSLSQIAQTYLGDLHRFPEIVRATQTKHAQDPTFAALANPNMVKVGDKLWLPTAITPTLPTLKPLSPTLTTTTTVTLPRGKIAFSFWNNSPNRCTYEINVLDVTACLTSSAACQATRRVFAANNVSEPALSPNGQRLAFRSWGVIPETYNNAPHPYKGCAPGLEARYLTHMSLDATDLYRLGGFYEDGHPDWSPDGQRILFDTSREQDKLTRIMVINADGSGEGVLRLAGQHPSWAADNQRFVYRGCDVTGNQCGLRLAQATPIEAWDLGRNMLGLVVADPQAAHPDWSPLAEQIVYQSVLTGNWDIYRINTDGTGLQRLTTDPAIEGLPHWSPDGQWVAYLSNAGGNWGIWVRRADGRDPRLLFSYDGGIYALPSAVEPYGARDWFDEQLSWSP